MKTIVILEETARFIAEFNPDVFAIMTFLSSCVRDEDEHDFGRWVSYYARMSFDKKYGKGASDKAADILLKEKPKNAEEFVQRMEEFFDNL